jgi:hypothetical protein
MTFGIPPEDMTGTAMTLAGLRPHSDCLVSHLDGRFDVAATWR